ncbi:uncharacterized protein LOC102362665 [Latimeria chalumnae]|uniref:uncharacterized protein LOC102362665 n=1 Tax=Latimeria chalumnae TaxID=7897 RepID=UPI0003C125C6|nr:PREDICTED: uncharacterized protein LOC102362665 [Latimeria chalumnae]|eukprot:XP_005994612.1 PREDICTED: uncharacterized protein LOC102362665 [Latimeria chalumnae]
MLPETFAKGTGFTRGDACNISVKLLRDLTLCETFSVNAQAIIDKYDLTGTGLELQSYFVQVYASMCSSSRQNSTHITVSVNKDGNRKNVSFSASKVLRYCKCVYWNTFPCDPLQISYSTNVNLAVTTIRQHRNTGDMLLSFILSIPWFDPLQDIFPDTVALPNIGNMQGQVLLTYADAPTLLFRQSSAMEWLVPELSCCQRISLSYVCQCSLPYHPFTDACVFSANTKNTCLVQMHSGDKPMVNIAYSYNGTYCITTNTKRFVYGNISCNISQPNFCFQPQDITRIPNCTIYPITATLATVEVTNDILLL